MPRARKRVVLKWRKVKGEWRAGPFCIGQYPGGLIRAWIDCPSDLQRVVNSAASVDVAKRACEILASRILGAMQ